MAVPVTVATSLRLTVNFTPLPAPRSPVPAVIPVPDVITDDTVRTVVSMASICRPVCARPFSSRLAAFRRCVAPLRLIAVAASNAVFCRAPTWYPKVSCGLPCDSFSFD
jgi:hypothetical protein